jgi:GAF domain-containing protein
VSPTRTGPDGAPVPVPAGFGSELDDLHHRIRLARDQATSIDPVLVQDLETAYEELRVADEEVRAQQEEITALVQGRHLLRWQQERAMALMPVPVVITDGEGIIEFSNAAAAMLLHMGVARIVGKPLMVFFASEDRPSLRRLMSAHQRDYEAFRHAATLVGRSGAAVPVDCAVSALPGNEQSLSWVLLSAPGSGGRTLALPEALAAIAALPLRHSHRDDLMRAAAIRCGEVVGPDVCLSLVVGTPLHPEVLASTAQLAQSTDGAQITAGQGPCATAFELAETVVVEDVHTDPRWPALAGFLDPTLVGVVAIPLEVGETAVGALNLYTTGAVPPDLAEHGELLASTIAAVLHEVSTRQQLKDVTREMELALASRATIEQAKGIIMAHRGCGPDDAFAHLVSLSSNRHLKLREVAAQIVADAARRSG